MVDARSEAIPAVPTADPAEYHVRFGPLASGRVAGSRLYPCKRFSRRLREVGMVVKIVVPRVDRALKDQVPDHGAQRRAASCRHNRVALRDDQGGGREGAADELDRGHAIAEERPDRSPPVEITGHRLERVEGRDQDQSRNRSMPGEIGGDRSADAEADRKDAFARLIDGVDGEAELIFTVRDSSLILADHTEAPRACAEPWRPWPSSST